MRRGGLIALCWAAAATAAAPLDVVTVEANAVPMLRAGETVTVSVSVTIKPGYHVQANPVLNSALVPIVLAVPDTPFVRVGNAKYPSARRMRLLGSDEDLVVYDGTFVIGLPVSAAPGSPVGEEVLGGALRYQACDDRYCLFPRTIPVEIRVRTSGQ